jgi:PAS domain S-box-containing protein
VQFKERKSRKNFIHYSIYAILIFIVVSSAMSFWNRYVTYDTREIINRARLAKALIESLKKDVIHETHNILHRYANTGDHVELLALEKNIALRDSIFQSVRRELAYHAVDATDFAVIEMLVRNHSIRSKQIIQLLATDSLEARAQLNGLSFSGANQFEQFETKTFGLLDEIERNAESDYEWSIVDNAIIQIVLMILSIPILIIASRRLRAEVNNNENLLTQLEANNKQMLYDDGAASEISANAVIGKSINSLKLAFNFVEAVSNGQYQKAEQLVPEETRKLNNGTLLGALLHMGTKLQHAEIEEQKRQWSSSGLNQFSEMVRNYQHNRMLLMDRSVSFLTKYLLAQQGALFVLSEERGEQWLTLEACYAFDKKKFIEKRIEVGSGLVGQVFLERQPCQLTEIPQGYTSITSGLGDATPSDLLLVPFIYNEKVQAVFEVSGFNRFEKHHIEFLSKAGEFLASTLESVNTTSKMELLLEQAQHQTETLRAQEEELRQNMEEMQATQEEMARKSNELNDVMMEAKTVMAGLNATMAVIEFTPGGEIRNANSNFLKTMGYSLDQIKGRHHRMFVFDDDAASPEYKTFWRNLAEGHAMQGVFVRKNSIGEGVSLNAIYSPVRNAKGEVFKVLKFATDVTRLQASNAVLSHSNAFST